jgi:hypothetical protein
MPTLPLVDPDVVIGGGDVPVNDTSDVLALFPSCLQTDDPAPVRDALVSAMSAMFARYQELSAYAAAQTDLLRATDVCLDAKCADRGVYRQAGEQDEPLRDRALAVPALCTPSAICAAADAVLAPYTSVKSQYCEASLDRWFVRSHGSAWSSHVYPATTTRAPNYPDRLYPEDSVANGGLSRHQSTPGGAMVFNDARGRMFVLRVPDISPIDDSILPIRSRSNHLLGSPPLGMFVGSGASSLNASYPRANPATALGVYQAVADSVNRIKGQGIRWRLYADPKLKG